jgi:hypothetical protein
MDLEAAAEKIEALVSFRKIGFSDYQDLFVASKSS